MLPPFSSSTIIPSFPKFIFKSSKPLNFAPPTVAFAVSSSQSLQSETLTVLEWPAICRQLSPFASTSMAQAIASAASIPIGTSQGESQKLLNQTSDALEMISDSGFLNLSSVEDISVIVESAVAGKLLNLSELCTVKRTLTAIRDAFELLSYNSGARRYSSLLEVLETCNFQSELAEKINFCIDCNLSTILDRASEELEIIRSERKQNMEKLENLLKNASNAILQAGGIDRAIVTKRRSRLCIGIKATHRNLLPGGIVLDSSSSGATYFMEPKEAVELNNMEVFLSNSEKHEETAILSMLTSDIAEISEQIKSLLKAVIEIDLAFARAAHALKVEGKLPIWTSESVDIESIRHPILLESSNGTQVVPIDIKVKSGTRVVVLSGPNTGGKTASMKTLGVASLMSKAGFFLPAKGTPQLPWFDFILADIGDYQSIEQSLSTFSGHVSQIREILEVATENSLVLIDEICSGTDPNEGVALSTSILQYLKNRVNLAVVTTHYADLSLLTDSDARFDNAAMEFSLKTLLPTYQIVWGSAGESNALTIAKSIGFSEEIINLAKAWVDKLTPELQQQRKGLLYQSLIEERNYLQAEALKVCSLHSDIVDLYREMKLEADDLDARVKALMSRATEEVQRDVNDVRARIHIVVAELEKRVKSTAAKHMNSVIRDAESEIRSIMESQEVNEKASEDINEYNPEAGEKVMIKSLGDKVATVVRWSEGDEEVLVKYGGVRVRVKRSDLRAAESEGKASDSEEVKKQIKQYREAYDENAEYSPRVKTSRNTVDLRGMRVEEACRYLEMAIASRESKSVMFLVHGVGTGAVKQRVLDILRKHPLIHDYEPESPTNFGCTVAYLK